MDGEAFNARLNSTDNLDYNPNHRNRNRNNN